MLLIMFLNGLEARATKTDDSKVIVNFAKTCIFARFGTPRPIISDRGTYFCDFMTHFRRIE